jgi:hypothetical protein
MSLIRGCDVRKWGNAYFEDYIVDNENVYQVPIEKFCLCPPWEVDLEQLGLSQQGMRIIERTDLFGKGIGIWDLWDYIGHSGYPYAVDFLEEARRFGTSRLIPKPVIESAAFKLLKPEESMHMFVHDRALLTQESAEKIQAHRLGLHDCPLNVESHNSMKKGEVVPCFGLNWECIQESASTNTKRKWWVPMPRVENPTFAYEGATAITNWKVKFEGTAVFMALPLSKAELCVIEDPLEHKEADILKLLGDIESQFPYKMAQE